MKPNYPKLVFAALLTIYFLWIAARPFDGSFLDVVDLAIHETGHLLFRPFGEFTAVAGGSAVWSGIDGSSGYGNYPSTEPRLGSTHDTLIHTALGDGSVRNVSVPIYSGYLQTLSSDRNDEAIQADW